MKNTFCTICSANYLAYALSLIHSYFEQGGQEQFYICIVDRKDVSLPTMDERISCAFVEDLNIPKWEEYAFVYDIVEFNTAVKPTFLKYLFRETGADVVTYMDPDTFFFSSPEQITDLHRESSIILTPHALTPHPITDVPGERMYLKIGNFNLGFVSVRAGATAFLNWWEERCLNLCFNEPYTGLFVDQKWCNLVPILFDGVNATKHAGLNMGNWNLHERRLSRNENEWRVNESWPLVFFHFSGLIFNDDNAISKHVTLTLTQREDLRAIFDIYRQQVRKRKAELPKTTYSFETYDDGALITNLARKVYLAASPEHKSDSPFSSIGEFRKFVSRKGLTENGASGGFSTAANTNRADIRLKAIHILLRLAARILGGSKYELLLKYLAYIAMPRHQGYVFFEQNSLNRAAIDFES